MRRILRDRRPPRIERTWPRNKTLAQRGCYLGLAVLLDAGVIAEYAKARPVEHLQPALDRNLPVRMLAEEAADDGEPDRFVRSGSGRHVEGLVSGSHDLADGRTELRLQLAIVAAL